MIIRVIMNNLGYVWLLVSLMFLLAEISTPGLFFFIAFATGCVVAAIAAFMGYPIAVQCIVSLISALLAFWIMRKKFSSVFQSGDELKTNYTALTGQKALVIKEITPAIGGQVRVKGEYWSARSEGDEILPVGTEVIVQKLEGNCLIIIRRGAS